jgi:TetR/AcrR family transcriptional regulator
VKRAPKQDRSEQTKARILTVARQHFSINGFESSNIRDIAKDAGTTHAMITYHFGNKEALWKDAIRDMFQRLRSFINDDSEVQNDLNDPKVFKAFVKRYVIYCAKHPEHARIMLIESVRGGERLKWMVDNFIRPVHKEVYLPALRRHMTDGVLPDIWEISLISIITTICQIPFVMATEIDLIYEIDFMDDAVIEKHVDSVMKLLFC